MMFPHTPDINIVKWIKNMVVIPTVTSTGSCASISPSGVIASAESIAPCSYKHLRASLSEAGGGGSMKANERMSPTPMLFIWRKMLQDNYISVSEQKKSQEVSTTI